MIQKSNGFTLFETIFSLFLISIVLFLFPFILAYFKTAPAEKLQAKEVELFFIQISREIYNAKEMLIENKNLIVVLHNEDKVSYEQYNDLIRRRVNERGHEVLLQNIKAVDYELNHSLVVIRIEGKDGERYERKFARRRDDHAEA